MQNPRRAYRGDGSIIPPVTVGQHLADGFRLAEILCGDCHHMASIDVSSLPFDLPILTFPCARGARHAAHGNARAGQIFGSITASFARSDQALRAPPLALGPSGDSPSLTCLSAAIMFKAD